MARLRAIFGAAALRASVAIRSPAADFVCVKLAGETVYRKLKLSDLAVIYQRLGLAVEWRQLVADVAARRLAVAAVSLDHVIHFYNRHFEELLAAADEVSIDFSKGLADQIDAADAAVIALQKGVADDIVTVDGVSLSFAKAFADALAPTDQVAISVHLSFADSVDVVDMITMTRGPIVAETATATDSVSMGFSKPLADAVTASDSVTIIVSQGPYPHSLLNGHPLGDFMLGD